MYQFKTVDITTNKHNKVKKKMTNKKEQEIINTNKRGLLDKMQKLVYNVVRLNTGNTWEHERMKAEICYTLQRNGRQFLTEVQLRTGGRPDILVMDTIPPVAYEIMVSESDKSINEKEAKYHGIKLIKVRVPLEGMFNNTKTVL